MTDLLVDIQDLYVNYTTYEGVLKVLNGVYFKVRKGEKIGLIGEAGCGKTTTVKSIMKILPMTTASITKGAILYKGKDILRMGRKEIQTIRRKNISMIFQDPTAALNPVYKIGEQLSDVIKYSTSKGGIPLSKKEIKDISIKVLKEVAMPDPERIMANYPFQLSGGMKQRVCIAMATASADELLIADEPGTNLDVTIQDQILRLLGRLVEEKGTSTILISNAIGAVKSLVDKVYVMYAGNVVETAKTEDLFTEPLHPYTRALFNAIPKLTGGGVPKGIRGKIPNYLNPPRGCRFHPRCDKAISECLEKTPLLFQVENDHEVACIHFKG